MFESKYGVARHIYIPIPKAGSANHAVGADWTPAAGDVKISKDGGAAANVTNLPTAVAMGNSAIWDFSLTATEMQAAQVVVTVADSATKAVDDTGFIIETYGHASAQHEFDRDTASTAQTGDAYAIVNSGTHGNAALKTLIDTVDDFIDTEIAAIKAKTDNLPADPADASDIAGSFATVNATLATIAGYIDTEVAAIKAKTDNLPSDPADASDIAGSFTTVNTTLATIAAYIDTEVAAIKAKTDNLPAAPAAVGDIPTATAIVALILATQITESYRANGAAPTLAQFMSEVLAHLSEAVISGTTKTVKKFDHSTTAATFTLDSATDPSSITRAS